MVEVCEFFCGGFWSWVLLLSTLLVARRPVLLSFHFGPLAKTVLLAFQRHFL